MRRQSKAALVGLGVFIVTGVALFFLWRSGAALSERDVGRVVFQLSAIVGGSVAVITNFLLLWRERRRSSISHVKFEK